MPAGSKAGPVLPRAKPISHDAASGVTELRRGEKRLHNSNYRCREEWESVRATTVQTPGSVKKEGERRLHCSLWWRPWSWRTSPCGRDPPQGRGRGPHPKGMSSRGNVLGTDHNSHSPFPYPAGEEVEETMSEIKPRKEGREEGWEGVSRFGFISHFPTLIWLVINSMLISPSRVHFAHGGYCWVIIPCPYPMSLSLYFLSTAQLRRGVTKQLWWASDGQPGSTGLVCLD